MDIQVSKYHLLKKVIFTTELSWLLYQKPTDGKCGGWFISGLSILFIGLDSLLSYQYSTSFFVEIGKVSKIYKEIIHMEFQGIPNSQNILQKEKS